MKTHLFDTRDAAAGKDAGLAAAIAELGKKMQAAEDGLFQATIAEGDTKSFRDPQKVYEKLSVLAGDLSGSVDFAPNRQQREVFAVLKERLAAQKELFGGVGETGRAV